jgi:hypothetical protein
MAKFDPNLLIKKLVPDSLRVHAPTSVMFLCGGVLGDPSNPPVMFRDAFYRIAKNSELDYQIILAEQASPLTADAEYRDLLQFEQDIAQVVGLILLFVESAGSLAELGAFAALPTVAPSLLAVVDEYYYEQNSFVKNGPIRFLENNFGEEWVVSLERSVVGIDEKGTITNLNAKEFIASLKPVIQSRLSMRASWRKVNPEASGDVILIIVGLCQFYGALTIGEIRKYLEQIGVAERRIGSLIYCAKLLGWIKVVRKGHNIFYVGVAGEPALDFKIDADKNDKDKLRWRTNIRQHWKENDGPRFRAIGESVSAIGPGELAQVDKEATDGSVAVAADAQPPPLAPVLSSQDVEVGS